MITDKVYQRRVAGTALGVGAITFVLFVAFLFTGIIARTSQGGFINLRPDVFYQFMTIHSIGIGGSLMTGVMAVMWYTLRKHVYLSMNVMMIAFGLVGAAVVTLLFSTLVGYYGTGWTYLFPLTFKSAGAWDPWAGALYLFALGTVITAYYLAWGDVVIKCAKQYGFASILGWRLITGSEGPDTSPPPVVIISSITALCGVISLFSGSITIVQQLLYWADPNYYIDYLFMKNLIYYFGHIVMNMIMYMSAAVVYELLPIYAKRPWKSNKILAISWNTAFIAVTLAYLHHLLQDFVQPLPFQIVAIFGSYLAAFPATVVTITGSLIIVYKSGMKWNVAPLYFILGLMGWAIGGVAAVLDAGFNSAFHNTMFVPGHFHTYLLAGAAFIFVGGLHHITQELGGAEDTFEDKLGLWTWLIGAYGFVGMFAYSGIVGTPRRYAVQMPGTEIYSTISVYFAWLVLFAVILALGRYLNRLQRVKPMRGRNIVPEDLT